MSPFREHQQGLRDAISALDEICNTQDESLDRATMYNRFMELRQRMILYQRLVEKCQLADYECDRLKSVGMALLHACNRKMWLIQRIE